MFLTNISIFVPQAYVTVVIISTGVDVFVVAYIFLTAAANGDIVAAAAAVAAAADDDADVFVVVVDIVVAAAACVVVAVAVAVAVAVTTAVGYLNPIYFGIPYRSKLCRPKFSSPPENFVTRRIFWADKVWTKV